MTELTLLNVWNAGPRQKTVIGSGIQSRTWTTFIAGTRSSILMCGARSNIHKLVSGIEVETGERPRIPFIFTERKINWD